MPNLSVRAFAEMLNMPAYEQQRILLEQKYPRHEPQAFKLPYYQPALKGIRAYYLSNNNLSELTAARIKARGLRPATRVTNNLRVINSFANSAQSDREIEVIPQPKLRINASSSVELRLKFDLYGTENRKPKRIFYNLRSVPIDPATAKQTLEVAHWILDYNKTPIDINALEYVDLVSDDTIRIKRVSSKTSKMIAANLKIISTLWSTI